MIDLKALTRAASDLEPLPASVTRLASVIAKDDWEMHEVEQVVALDQALSSRLLRLANSAASGAAMPIVTIREAIVRMGAGALLSLATAATVQKRLQSSLPQFGYGEGELWRHSVAAALAAESAPAYCKVALPSESYAAALLHDVGKLVLARFLDPDILRVLTLARQEGHLSSLRAEAEILTVHHGELGGLIAQHWKLPARIVTGIIHHHTPDEAGDIVADVTYLANIIAGRVGTGYVASEDELVVNPSTMDRLKLTPERLDELSTQVGKRLEDVIARYSN